MKRTRGSVSWHSFCEECGKHWNSLKTPSAALAHGRKYGHLIWADQTRGFVYNYRPQPKPDGKKQ